MSDGPNPSRADAPSAGPETARTRHTPFRSTPNYAARRMLVGTAIITIVFAAGVVGWRWLGGGESTVARDTVTWSELAFVDRVTGDVTFVDHDGEVVREALGNGRTGSTYADGGVLALGSSRTLTVLPPSGSDDPPLIAELPARGTITALPTTAGTFLAIGSPEGGDVTLVDPHDRTVVDIGELVAGTLPSSPLMFVETMRANADGSLFAIADAANFQTIVVRLDDPEPVFLPDQPVAVGDELVATSQTVGLQADIALMALDRTTEATVPTEIPASGGVMTDDRLTIVSIDGGVFRVEAGDREAERIGTLATPADTTIHWAHPASDGERLVVAGDTFQAVIDLDGATLFSTVFATLVDVPAPDPRWQCLPVGGPGTYHSIIDLATGEQLADLTGLDVTGVSRDGCTVLARRNGIAELVSELGIVTIGRVDDAHLGPDGASVVTVTGDTTQLLTVDELELSEPIDLTRVAGTNRLVTFLPD